MLCFYVFICCSLYMCVVCVCVEQDKKLHELDLKRRDIQNKEAQEKVADRENHIASFNSQLIDYEYKYKQQNKLLENVTADRNQYRKTIIEQKNDIEESNRQYNNLLVQINNLKGEIASKDIGFVTEHFNLEEVMAKIKDYNLKNKTKEKSLSVMDGTIKKQADEVDNTYTYIYIYAYNIIYHSSLLCVCLYNISLY